MLASRKRFTGAVALAVVASGLLLVPSAPAVANPAGTGLVINEVYGGGGNTGAAYTNDFIELHNPSASAISVNGMSLQYRAAAGTGAPGSSNVFALPNKTIQPGGYFLVQAAAGATVTDKPLPVTPDAQTTGTTLNLSGTGGQIYLANGTAPLDAGTGTISNANVIDFVGWGTTTTSYEGAVVAPAPRNAAPATANATSISRKTTGSPAVVQDTDSNSADFATAVAPTPTSTSVAAALAVTDPGDKSVFVGTATAPISLTATGGTPPYTWQAAPLPEGLSLDGSTISGTPTTAGTTEVTLTATDSATPTAGTDTETFSITVSEAPSIKTIAEIQGTGDRSSYAPATGTGQGTETLSTTGVVTGMYKDASFANSGFDGFTIQTGGSGATSGAASDGIFVYYGANAISADIAIGDSVQVTGKVSEFFGLTELNIAAAGVVELGSPLDAVTPLETAYPTTDAAREPLESMLIEPTGAFTVSNAYSTNQYGEIGLATGTTPLRQPTEFADATDDAALQAIRDENAERAVTLDDGTGVNYLANQTTKAEPVPYLTAADGSANAAPPRVGAGVTLESPVVLDYRNDTWKFQPTSPVYRNGADVATFEDTRTGDLHPANVGGDLTIATFNVLNYFNTTGEAYVLAGPQQNPPVTTNCTYYTDRASARIGNNTCGVVTDGVNAGNGPRGAATAASLARQEAKLANTVEALDADVIALEEIENSIKLPGETNRDDAVSNLVQILNTQAGETKWAYVRSPGEALTSGNIAEQDLIRPAFIYQVDSVQTVGKSDILFGTTQFANAREPLAQVFKAKGAPDADGFAVVVNHFKSKGDNASPAPPASGDNANHAEVGAFNGDRKRQAARLLTFADSFAEAREVDAVFLAGDFNSYTKEEPISILTGGGYEPIESDEAGEESYSYEGLSGSLDHVLGNPAAMAMVTGADIWEINANEAASFMYSRYNYNVTNFWQPNLPFGTSDHNPEIIGIDVPDVVATPSKEIQVIGTNDFHGRLLPDAGNAAGAAPFATAVKELKTENPNSIFVAAGDLVGASTFESFIQDDNPTIDALNAMGLEVSAAGNHEFDRGYDDFVGRIQDRADWQYIAANVEEPEGRDDLAETFTKTIDGVQVGFVGAVTEDLPALVNPSGIEGLTVTDIVEATNAAATALKADGADLVVLLVHEGSSSTDCSSPSFTDPGTVWGNIVQNTSPDVDAIISGHTHLAYNCRYAVADWADRAVTKRPVVSAGQYGTNLNQLVFKIDEGTGDLTGISQDVIATAGVGYAPDPTVQGIVDDAVDFADEAGAAVLGKMSAPFKRASYLASGNPTENRGGESTLNNQVAEVQRWATDADIAFMNPGGLRADMAGTANGDARDLTYRQAADVQPFANTLVKLTLTGAQLEKVLEEQWQRNAQGGVPSRPFLRLGVSKGLTYTYVETPETVNAPNSAPVNTFKGEITGMWLDGEPISPTGTYSVAVNSFLGGGGDNFWELANGTGKVDTGKVDLEAMVDYMEQYESTPLGVDYSQRGVEVTFPGDAPASYGPGATVSFQVASWAMSADGDATDSEIQVKLGDQVLGTPAVTVAQSTTAYDNIGTATVSVQLPDDIADGTKTLMLVGATTGTSVPVDINIDDGVEEIQILGTNDFHGRLTRSPSSAEAGAAVLSGAVKQLREANPNTVFAAAGDLIGASTFESFIQDDKPTIDALNEAGLEVSSVGNHEFDKGYDDLVNRVMAEYDEDDNPNGGAEWQYIGANVRLKSNDSHAIPASWIKDFGDVQVGFVGAVTEDLPSLVSPDGIEDIEVTSIVDEANAEAEALKGEGADIVVLLVHEGAATTALSSATDDSAFGKIVKGVDGDIDAIVSGHTHLAYNHAIEVPEWVTEGREVTTRPVVSAGQYGYNLNKLVFSYDPDAGEVVGLDQSLVALQSCTNCPPPGTQAQVWAPNFPADPAVTSIVDAAVADSEVLGAAPLGELGGGFNRAKLSNGTTENRGGESTLGNLVAEVQRWATSQPESGAAQIAFMNPGGLRTDMVGTGPSAFPRTLTYKQAAVVQPFANTLVNMDLSGANIKLALEQQWQRDGGGAVPSRPFLRLGISDGFKYTYDPAKAEGSRITGMWLDGEPIDAESTYSVTVNSFLASGGDNFRAFNNGTGKQDTGKVDLEAMVDYMKEFGSEGAVPVDYSQRSVGVSFPSDAPASYAPGETVTFSLSSLAMTAPGDKTDPNVTIWLGETPVKTVAVDNTVGDAVFDEAGKATIEVVIPPGTSAGAKTLSVRSGETGTGTDVPVAIRVSSASLVSAGDDIDVTWGQATSIPVEVTGNDGVATGEVRLFEDETQIGSEVDLVEGEASLDIAAKSLEPGAHTLRVEYSDGNYPNGSDEVVVTVAKATTTVTAGDVTATYGESTTVTVTLGDASATGEVEVRDGDAVLGSADVSDGVATVTLPAGSLEPGVTELTAAYGGDDHFKVGTDEFTATLAKATTTVTAGDVTATYGEPATVTVTLGDDTATGEVEVRDGATVLGSADVADGVASVTLPAGSLEPGVTELTAAYGGDDHFKVGTDEFTATVAKATTAVSAADVSGTYGQSIVVAVTVADNTATGTVEVRNGATVLGTGTVSGGTASVTLPAGSLEPGVADLTAAYGGDGHFKAGTDEFTATVAKATTAVSAADVSGTYGQPIVVAVTVADNTATGTVEVRNGATVLGTGTVSGGTASVTLPAGSLEPGVTNLTAAYAGDGHFLAGTDAFTATVAKAASTVSAGNVSLTYGKAGTVTVNVSPGSAGGTVQLFDGTTKVGAETPVSGGVATVTLPARSLAPGSNALRAEYSGDARVTAGSANLTVTVAKAASSTKVKASPATAKVKKTRVTLKITVSGPSGVAETGKVKVKIPGQGTKTVTLRSGKATLKLAKFTSTGTKTIRIDYLGSDLLKPSADTVKIKVVKK